MDFWVCRQPTTASINRTLVRACAMYWGSYTNKRGVQCKTCCRSMWHRVAAKLTSIVRQVNEHYDKHSQCVNVFHKFKSQTSFTSIHTAGHTKCFGILFATLYLVQVSHLASCPHLFDHEVPEVGLCLQVSFEHLRPAGSLYTKRRNTKEEEGRGGDFHLLERATERREASINIGLYTYLLAILNPHISDFREVTD